MHAKGLNTNTNPGYRVYPKFSPGGLANQIEIIKLNYLKILRYVNQSYLIFACFYRKWT